MQHAMLFLRTCALRLMVAGRGASLRLNVVQAYLSRHVSFSVLEAWLISINFHQFPMIAPVWPKRRGKHVLWFCDERVKKSNPNKTSTHTQIDTKTHCLNKHSLLSPYEPHYSLLKIHYFPILSILFPSSTDCVPAA